MPTHTSIRSPNVYHYFPAVACAEFDSPIDALVALGVPRDEACDMLVAAWPANRTEGANELIMASVYGGRAVAVLHLPTSRWAACKVFLEEVCPTPQAAERRMGKLLKRSTRSALNVTGLFSLQVSAHHKTRWPTFTNADTA